MTKKKAGFLFPALNVQCSMFNGLRLQPPARVLTATALLGTRRVVLPNSVLDFTHCRKYLSGLKNYVYLLSEE